MPLGRVSIFIGTIIHCDKPFSIEKWEKGFVMVKNSKILAVDQLNALETHKKALNVIDYEIISLSKNQFLIPGFIDTHNHPVQYPNIGLGYDKPLLEWLQTYTYPLELRYKDLKFSKKVYDIVVEKTLANGTTTVCYFASLFPESCHVLADSVTNFGQRALIGKVNITQNAPEAYTESIEENLLNTEVFIQEILARKNDLVFPIITPRFALCLDADSMKKLGDLAAKYNCHVQTHISENKEEVKIVKEIYKAKNYAQVYHDAGILTNKTILAHGVYLSDDELDLILKQGTSISHCPSSNVKLQSGRCDVRRLMHKGIKVGLGTDISGGNNVSILEAIRAALDTSIHISFGDDGYKPINCYEGFYLATLGGAEALGMSDKIGNFKEGKEFDALIIDMGDEVDLNCKSIDDLLQKFIYTGDDRNVKHVYVSGKKVK